MTGNFKEFKADSHTNGAWDQQNAMASTAVCISLWQEYYECRFNDFSET